MRDLIHPSDLRDVAIILVVGFGLYMLPQIIQSYAEPQRDEYRGCVASAYQAASNGFDLEDNLNYCNEL